MFHHTMSESTCSILVVPEQFINVEPFSAAKIIMAHSLTMTQCCYDLFR